MITPQQRQMAMMIRKLAKLMRKDVPNEWPGLPGQFGGQPSRTGANIFILGSAVDGGQQPADIAWRAAQRFVLGVVPIRERERMWDWIVRYHTLSDWRRKRSAYGLHRNRLWHSRVYRFAEFISRYLNGDARNIWRHVPDGVASIDYTRSILHAMRFGPALSRMVVGALLDHGLLKGDSAFKDDIHVRRGMRLLGLASSKAGRAVLEAGERFFGANSWEVDLAFYRLGEQGYKTRRQIESYYRRRIDDRGDEDVRCRWRKQSRGWQNVVNTAIAAIEVQLGESWEVIPNHGNDYLGFEIRTTRGLLRDEFMREYLQVWTGAALNVPEACVEIWNHVEFDIDGPVARSLKLRDALRAAGYKCSYDDFDRWETHYKRVRNCSIAKRPERLARGVLRSLSGATEEAIDILGNVRRR